MNLKQVLAFLKQFWLFGVKFQDYYLVNSERNLESND